MPNKLLISNISIRRSAIARVFLDNPKLFEDHRDGEYLGLMVFIIYEMLKGMRRARTMLGDKSLWKPYFDVFPDADILAKWTPTELAELQDPELMTEALNYKEEVEEEWLEVKPVLEEYPGIFPMSKVTKKMFDFVYSNVVTRCFGWSLPCTMMVPIGDCLNHADIDASNEMINTELQESALREGNKDEKARKYLTKAKRSLDISDLNQTAESVLAGREETRKVAVREIVVDDDVVTVCRDMSSLSLKDKDYDIWNVYKPRARDGGIEDSTARATTRTMTQMKMRTRRTQRCRNARPA